ncbi:MAG: hypothetical protein GEV12_07510 [Micromonosporaceae bacterium]|nr:hypothetical protein [Micromonosporaceae bacterium]
MPADNLGIKERAALLALMAEARDVSNRELETITGFRLTGEPLRRLRARNLVESHRVAGNRPFVHVLTDEGWAWCAAELAAERPPRAGSAAGALYAVLAGLDRYLQRSNLRLADVFRRAGDVPVAPEPPSTIDLQDRIVLAYRKLAAESRELVSLTQLRPLLDDVPRDSVDAALRQMSRAWQANLVPQANQKTLSRADREAAVRIGNEDCHLVSVVDK